MGKRKAINIAKKFSLQAKDIISVTEILLYGSYARGDFNKDSDIDIALVVKNDKYNFSETYSKLSELCRKIDTRIEPIVLEKNKDFSGFLDTIYKEGILIYKAA